MCMNTNKRVNKEVCKFYNNNLKQVYTYGVGREFYVEVLAQSNHSMINIVRYFTIVDTL